MADRACYLGFADQTSRTIAGLIGLVDTDRRAQVLDVPEAELSVDGGLPDPLSSSDGVPITSAALWHERRRPELLELFAHHVYGRTPSADVPVTVEVLSEESSAIGGAATRVESRLRLGGGPSANLLLYLPNEAGGPAPAFLGLNFWGNHAVEDSPGIALSGQWIRGHGVGVVKHRATEAARGSDAASWPLARIIGRGYAVATVYYGDLDPDYDDGFGNGVHPLFYGPGQSRPGAHEWGAIGAWAWGLSRVLDQLEMNPRVDAGRVAVLGHSRLGKAALWAAAQDQRFAMAVSNNSGCGGAALSRRRSGETVEAITNTFPHWFCSTFVTYADNEEALPVDQHELIALIAPRPVCVGSGEEDSWADPFGEFLGARYADPVYRLLGVDGLSSIDLPTVGTALAGGRISYHIRPGGHGITPSDWDRYLGAADLHLRNCSR